MTSLLPELEALPVAMQLDGELVAWDEKCGNLSCAEQITLTPQAYERARSSPTRFIVKPGHEAEDLEVVVDGGADYHVVETTPADARQIAEQTNPRN